MIGTILSMKFIGKKTWLQALLFWIVYIVAAAVISSIIPMGIVIAAVVFILLAHFWPMYGLNWWEALKVFAVAVVIDIIIVAIIFAILLAIGLSMIDFLGLETVAESLIRA